MKDLLKNSQKCHVAETRDRTRQVIHLPRKEHEVSQTSG